MPGPAGGHGGGGFHGGGFSGGSHRGPSGYHGHPGHFYYGPGYYYHGGGCISWLLGVFFAPLFVLVIAIVFIMAGFGILQSSSEMRGSGETQYTYDEGVFQTYALSQYKLIYDTNNGFEDNLLVVFVNTPEHESYARFCMAGYHLTNPVQSVFDNEHGIFMTTLDNYIEGEMYKNSLPMGLKNAVDISKYAIINSGSKKYECDESGRALVHELKIYSPDYSEENMAIVQNSLIEFVNETGISLSIVVVDAEDVFEKEANSDLIFGIIGIILVFVAVAIVVISIVSSKKAKKEVQKENNSSPYNEDGSYTNSGNSAYDDFNKGF